MRQSRVVADAVDFARAAIALRIALEMAEEALGIELDRGWAIAGAAVLEDLAHRVVHREEIAAVALARKHAETPRRGWRCPVVPTA